MPFSYQSSKSTAISRLPWKLSGALATALLALASCSNMKDPMNKPAETEYTQAEAYAPMEAAVADAIEVLPDFPGFEKRAWAEVPCEHNGQADSGYTDIEIQYWFSSADSGSDLVREQYVDLLRDHWASLGYEKTYEEQSDRADGSVNRDIAVKRDDGITLWYSAAGYTVLTVQSGCVPVSELNEFEYIPPAGGIEPGSDKDRVEKYFPDGIPTDQAAAVDPFATSQAAFGPVPFDSPDSYDGLI
jgi:hypothetical protein